MSETLYYAAAVDISFSQVHKSSKVPLNPAALQMRLASSEAGSEGFKIWDSRGQLNVRIFNREVKLKLLKSNPFTQPSRSAGAEGHLGRAEALADSGSHGGSRGGGAQRPHCAAGLRPEAGRHAEALLAGVRHQGRALSAPAPSSRV